MCLAVSANAGMSVVAVDDDDFLVVIVKVLGPELWVDDLPFEEIKSLELGPVGLGEAVVAVGQVLEPRLPAGAGPADVPPLAQPIHGSASVGTGVECSGSGTSVLMLKSNGSGDPTVAAVAGKSMDLK